jgi:toxin ParE1/3/4
VNAVYVVLPKADLDLDEQAYYFATQENPTLGHRFLLAAHETFVLLAGQPHIGWHPRLQKPQLESLRVFHVLGFRKILVLYRPLPEVIEIVRVLHGSRNLRALMRRQELE